jgi:hypothetical protein
MRASARRLYEPRRVPVRAGSGGVPLEVGNTAVRAVREEWVVEDRWWTPRPLHRHYYELILADGRDAVVFRSLAGPRQIRTSSSGAGTTGPSRPRGGRAAQWYLQRA